MTRLGQEIVKNWISATIKWMPKGISKSGADMTTNTLGEQKYCTSCLKMAATLGLSALTHPFRVNFIPLNNICFASVLARDSKNLLTPF